MPSHRPEETGSAEQAIEASYADAQTAEQRGDRARARSSLEHVLSLLDPADAPRRSVVLSGIASLLASDGEAARAIELWEQVLILCDQIGDVRGRSLTLDKMADTRAREGNWPAARVLWEQALEIDTRLGNAPDRAATLTNLALAVARTGGARRATQLWNEAFDAFVALGNARGCAALLKAMNNAAVASQNWSDPENLRERALEFCEGKAEWRGVALALDGLAKAAADPRRALPYWQRAHSVALKLADRHFAAVLLASMAACRAALGELPLALELWRDSLADLEAVGDAANHAAALAAMRRAQQHGRTPPEPSQRAFARPLSKLGISSVSEYDVSSAAAPLFLVGELFAELHGRGLRLSGLRPGDVRVDGAALARVSRTVSLRLGLRLEPEPASLDLSQALERYAPEDAAALLSGYARRGYELLDSERPGFTDALLTHLDIPEPRPRTMPAPIDVPALLRQLQIELSVNDSGIRVALLAAPATQDVWQQSPRDAFQLILALLVVGVDCRPLFERDMTRFRLGSHSPLYRLLWPNQAEAVDALAQQHLELASGMELAFGLGQVLRRSEFPEPIEFNELLIYLEKLLTSAVDEQVARLGDILIHVALFCARLTATGAENPLIAEGFAQKGIIMLQHASRGRPSDEGRLVAVTTALRELPRWPRPFEPWTSSPHLGMLNSLLITQRELASKSLAQLEGGATGMLRSAAVRCTLLARHTLRVSYETAASRDPDAATFGLLMLRTTVKNYSCSLCALAQSFAHDAESGRQSGWQPHFAPGSTLLSEMVWITDFLGAAASEGFSLDVARHFLRLGSEFIAESNTFEAPPAIAGVALA